jgi:hypothetical protein
MDVAPPPAPGALVAGYRIDGPIARGGMGVVYLARDLRLDRPVALKLLTEPLARDDAFRERLVEESRIAASLDHPNVIPVYDAGEADGWLYIAMRYVPGTDLRALLRREGALDPGRALRIAGQVATALDAAHARGLVHRDVKPSNVLIDEPGGREHCYLADFGLTRTSSARDEPADGSLMGTIDYVAPEQIHGNPVDGRADQYALACLIFECLAGTPPFAGRSDVATIYAHLEEEPPAASSHRPGTPQALDDVLRRGMAKEPSARFESCAELVAEARRAAGLDTAPKRGRLIAAVAVLTLAVAALVAVVTGLLGGDDAPASPKPPGTLARIDARTGEVTRRFGIAARPGSIAAGSDQVWVAAFYDGSLWRLNARTEQMTRLASVGNPRDLAYHDGRIYVGADGPEQFEGNVASYDARGGGRLQGIDLNVCSVTGGATTGVWATACPFVEQLEVGQSALRVKRELMLPFREPLSALTLRGAHGDMTTGDHAVWVVGDNIDPRIWRIDSDTGRITASPTLPVGPRSAAVGGGAVWVTAPLDDVVVRVDERTARVTDTIDVGRSPAGVAADDDGVWVANQLDGTVSRIDPRSGRVVGTVEVGGRPTELAMGSGAVWVTVDER